MNHERLILPREEVIRRVVPYDVVPGEALQRLFPLLEERDFEPGERIIIQGDRVDKTIHFIAAGQAEVTRDPFGMGKPTTIAVLGPGDVVGEMAILSNEPRNATVTAKDQVKTYALSGDNWHHLTAFYPGLASRLQEIAQRRQEENLRRATGLL